MSDEKAGGGGGGEIDALRWYVYGMVAVSVLGAGFLWWNRKQTDALRTSIDAARKSLAELAEAKKEIQAMVGAYKRNREDVARDQPLTWFSELCKRKGIDFTQSIDLGKWKYPPEISPDGSFVEEKITIGFKRANPLRREQVGQFLHEIEHSSSRLRVITLTVSRAGREEALENDEWTGKCEVGYRYPHVRE